MLSYGAFSPVAMLLSQFQKALGDGSLVTYGQERTTHMRIMRKVEGETNICVEQSRSTEKELVRLLLLAFVGTGTCLVRVFMPPRAIA